MEDSRKQFDANNRGYVLMQNVRESLGIMIIALTVELLAYLGLGLMHYLGFLR